MCLDIIRVICHKWFFTIIAFGSQAVIDEPYSPPPIKEEPEGQFIADQQPSPAKSSTSSSSGSYEIEEPSEQQQQQQQTQQKTTRFARRTSEVKATPDREADVSGDFLTQFYIAYI